MVRGRQKRLDKSQDAEGTATRGDGPLAVR